MDAKLMFSSQPHEMRAPRDLHVQGEAAAFAVAEAILLEMVILPISENAVADTPQEEEEVVVDPIVVTMALATQILLPPIVPLQTHPTTTMIITTNVPLEEEEIIAAITRHLQGAPKTQIGCRHLLLCLWRICLTR